MPKINPIAFRSPYDFVRLGVQNWQDGLQRRGKRPRKTALSQAKKNSAQDDLNRNMSFFTQREVEESLWRLAVKLWHLPESALDKGKAM